MRLIPYLCSSLALGLATAQFERRYGAVPIAPDGLMPRYFFDKSNPVAKRAETCGTDQHSCLDVGIADQCCDDDTYCYINPTGALKCCPFGSTCDNPCTSRSYRCTRTTTASGTPSAQVGCCGPQCPSSSFYLCASSLGGECCENGESCHSGGGCVATKTASTSSTLTPAGGCTTSQYRCADGSGCCDNTQLCTEIGSTGYCASNPSATISVIPAPSSNELSDGAKAGIGVGAVVGAAIVIFLAWLCVSKRRQRSRTLSRRSGIEDSGIGGQESTAGAGGVDTMTEASGTEHGHGRVRQGLTQDYFGPDAVPGPFTETAGVDATSPGYSRAVPTRPDGPGDITAAVEIDSRAREPSSGYLSPLTNSSVEPTPISETIDGRFELYGSDGREPLSIVPTPQESPYGKSSRPTE